MLKRIWQWLFGKPRGYTCDGCDKWTLRKEGKALVECRNPGTYLFCPDCAELKRYAKEQAEKAKAAAA
jgi:RNase P subunit RPR2